MTRIDLAALEALAGQRRFEDRTLEIAKRLFIHEEAPKRLSVEYGVNIQRVYAIRREVLAAVASAALPAGWEQVTISGPKDLIDQIKRQVAEALAHLDADSAGPEALP